MCRWREESPFSKRVVRLADATVLDWFRRGWDCADPDEWIASELGGDVYGLESVFEEAQERRLPKPESVDELRSLLHEYLWVEGDEGFIRLDEHGLRVRTDDDEVDLAYYFLEDPAPDRVAYLLHDTWPLPGDATDAEADAVYSVRISWEHIGTGTNLDLTGAVVFPGVSLPDLAGHLDDLDGDDRRDVRLLRDLVRPGDDGIGPAMERYLWLAGYHPVPGTTRDTLPLASRLAVRPHIAQVARYIDNFFGFDQWFLFDTRWAAAHPDLARSLLRYAAHWDPYET